MPSMLSSVLVYTQKKYQPLLSMACFQELLCLKCYRTAKATPLINALSTCPVSVENSSFIMEGRLLQQSSAVTKNNRGAPGGRS